MSSPALSATRHPQQPAVAPVTVTRLLLAHLELTKPILSLWIAAAAAAAYLAARPLVDATAIVMSVSVLLLAGSGATFNNLQDRALDRRFRRTRQRPLVSGEVLPGNAAAQGFALALFAYAGLGMTHDDGILLGMLALILYNGVYTPLKRRSALAILPGALAGALPIVIGWIAAGGGWGAPGLWLLVAILVVWQLPHVWLLQLQQRSNDNQSCSSLPTLLHRLSEHRLRQLLLVCVAGFAGLSLLLPCSGLVTSPMVTTLLVGHAVGLLLLFLRAAYLRPSPTRDRVLFHYWNGVVAGILLLIVIDNLWLQ